MHRIRINLISQSFITQTIKSTRIPILNMFKFKYFKYCHVPFERPNLIKRFKAKMYNTATKRGTFYQGRSQSVPLTIDDSTIHLPLHNFHMPLTREKDFSPKTTLMVNCKRPTMGLSGPRIFPDIHCTHSDGIWWHQESNRVSPV